MKKICICLIVLLLTGCSVDYNLVITNDVIKENVKISVPNKKMLEEFSSVDEYLDYYSNIYKQMDGYKKYKIKTKEGKLISTFNVKNTHKNINDYFNSYSYLRIFDDVILEQTGKYTTVETTENLYLKNQIEGVVIDENYYFDEFVIKIKFYNTVVSSNADKVDTKNNVYTWYVTGDNPKSQISFKYSDKIKYDVMIKDYISTNIVAVSIVSGLIILAITISLYLFIKIRRNNRI